jgi:hypothetical protein
MGQQQWWVRKESRLCQVRTRRRLQKERREERRKGESAAAVRCRVRGGNIGEVQRAAITHITATARAAIAVGLATMYLPAEGLGSLHLPRYERRENVKGRENVNGNCGRRIGDGVMRF